MGSNDSSKHHSDGSGLAALSLPASDCELSGPHLRKGLELIRELPLYDKLLV
jgi:hypothetical protein